MTPLHSSLISPYSDPNPDHPPPPQIATENIVSRKRLCAQTAFDRESKEVVAEESRQNFMRRSCFVPW